MGGRLDGPDDTQSPLKGGSEILVKVCEIVPHKPNLVAVASEKCRNFLVIHAFIDGSFTDLEAVHVDDRQNGPRVLGVNICGSMPSAVGVWSARGCQLTAKFYSRGCGPVSASSSPMNTGTINSGLSITAPRATARAYPSPPPS